MTTGKQVRLYNETDICIIGGGVFWLTASGRFEFSKIVPEKLPEQMWRLLMSSTPAPHDITDRGFCSKNEDSGLVPILVDFQNLNASRIRLK